MNIKHPAHLLKRSTQILSARKDMNPKKLQENILAGRSAIEYCMIKVVIRPKNMTNTDNHELYALSNLLRQFTKLMNRYQPNQYNVIAANDENGESL